MSVRRLLVLMRGLGYRREGEPSAGPPEVLHERGLDALDTVPELRARNLDITDPLDPRERPAMSPVVDMRAFAGGVVRYTPEEMNDGS